MEKSLGISRQKKRLMTVKFAIGILRRRVYDGSLTDVGWRGAGSEDPNEMPLANHGFELAAPIAIALGSAALFVYWFRYTCLLLLTSKTPRDHGQRVAASNGLSFPEVGSFLPEAEPSELDLLSEALDRDYAVLLYLLKHTPPRPDRESTLERRMLRVYYRMLRIRYLLSRGLSDQSARSALVQMCSVVAGFADIFGARVAET